MFLSLHYLLALVLILSVHEFAHAWVALRLGDPTAERAGRVSLNPMRHLDFLGTLMLFFAGFGWGKPVPVNPANFKNPRRDEAIVAFSGPLANLFLAILAAIPFSYVPPSSATEGILLFSGAVMELSLVLFFFNMLPIPPLDGAGFMRILVPDAYQGAYGRFLRQSMPYFIAFMVVDIYFLRGLLGFSIVWEVVSTATFWLKSAILVVV